MQPNPQQIERDIERTHRVLAGVTDQLSVRTLKAYAAELEDGLAVALRKAGRASR